MATRRALRALEATGKTLMAGEISFDAAHVICRAAAQIPDPAMVQVAEEQMLAFAASPHRTGPCPDQTDRTAAGHPDRERVLYSAVGQALVDVGYQSGRQCAGLRAGGEGGRA